MNLTSIYIDLLIVIKTMYFGTIIINLQAITFYMFKVVAVLVITAHFQCSSFSVLCF